MRLRATAAIAVFAMLVVLLTGCSGKKNKSANKTTTTRFPPTVPVTNVELHEGTGICGFLTSSEVQAATTLTAQPGLGTRAATSESCRWTLRGTNQFVSLTMSGGGGAQFDRSKDLFGGGEQLPGVGDRAFSANDTVYAQKGDKLLILEVLTSQTVPIRKAAAIKLMTSAIARA